ncbi:MAG: ABC transporter permease subunit, partial [Chloroflexota bacterium]
SWVLTTLRRSALLEWLSDHLLGPVGSALDRALTRLFGQGAAEFSPSPSVTNSERRVSRGVARIAVVLILGLVAAWGIVGAIGLLASVTPSEWGSVAIGALATFLRTTVTLVIGAAWTIPVGVWIGMNPKLAQRAQPVVQVVASIPATAVFPALLLVLLGLPGGLSVAAVALMLLGTQWYILFNVIAGAMAIPSDLREAAAVYKLSGWRRWRHLILPAIFPFLVTGMITATGGAWNASIVAEYVTFHQQTFSIVGLGSLIASAADAANFSLLLAGTLTMAAVVVAVNRLFWRRLYVIAEQRYRLE